MQKLSRNKKLIAFLIIILIILVVDLVVMKNYFSSPTGFAVNQLNASEISEGFFKGVVFLFVFIFASILTILFIIIYMFRMLEEDSIV